MLKYLISLSFLVIVRIMVSIALSVAIITGQGLEKVANAPLLEEMASSVAIIVV